MRVLSGSLPVQIPSAGGLGSCAVWTNSEIENDSKSPSNNLICALKRKQKTRERRVKKWEILSWTKERKPIDAVAVLQTPAHCPTRMASQFKVPLHLSVSTHFYCQYFRYLAVRFGPTNKSFISCSGMDLGGRFFLFYFPSYQNTLLFTPTHHADFMEI